MSTDPTLRGLLERLDSKQHLLAELDRYYEGKQPLAFLAPELRTSIGSRFGRMASNVPRLAVGALAERLRVTGFTSGGRADAGLWRTWIAEDMDQMAPVAHREALALGRSHVIVWAYPDGRASVSVESARQVAVLRDPGTRATTAAVKRWEAGGRTHAVVYEPDRITRYVSAHPGATAPAFTVERTIANPLGVVPVVELRNGDRLLDEGVSEISDLIPLVDALNKTLTDLLVSSEFYARPRRWATGIELEEDENGNAVNPFPEGDRMLISEEAASKFGQLPGADLGAYEAAVRVLLGQIMAMSALPAHYVGVFTDNPTSADSLRASEASLAARAEARQHTFGRSWEAVARLVVAVETGTDPTGVDVSVTWADPATRSVAQEADAVVKLHAAGILPTSFALARLGYRDDEIEQITAARRADAAAAAVGDVEARAALAGRLQVEQGLNQPAALAAAGLFAAATETRTPTTT